MWHYEFSIYELYLVIFFVTLTFYVYSARKVNYWKKRGIRGPQPLPFFGNVLDNLKKAIPHVELERYRKYGRIYGYLEFYQPTLTIGEPELIKEIAIKNFHIFPNRLHRLAGEPFCHMLIFLDDEHWKRVRVIINAAFTSSKIKRMYNLFLQVTDNTVERFEELATIGNPVNVREVFAVHTFDTITRSMFGVDINSHKGGNEKVIHNLEKFLDFSSWRWITVLFLPDFLQTWLGLQSAPDFILSYFEKTVKAVLEKRKQSGEKYNDILQVLLDAEAETEFAKGEEKDSFEGIEETIRRMNEENNTIKTTTVNVKKLSFNEILAQCVFLMLAGYHSSSVILSYIAHVLAFNADLDAKLYEELKRKVYGMKHITYENINSLMYLDGFVSEALRFYPPVTGFDLVASQDFKPQNADFTIEKGTRINFPTYALHHDPEFFPEPNKFKPDRFFPENRDSIIPCSYLPFGTGPRMCMGTRFAVLSIKLLLARLLLKYRFVRLPETPETHVFISKSDMLQFQDFHLGIAKRN